MHESGGPCAFGRNLHIKRFRLSTNILHYYKVVLFSLLDPKYLIPVFCIFFYKRSYLNHHHYGTTIKVWAGEQ